MLIDARSVSSGSELKCDVCVVGSGPAGVALTHRLTQSPLSVILLEAGGTHFEFSSQSFYSGRVIGESYYRLDGCRWRMFGGSSNRWGGWCRPLDPGDFVERDWLPLSGWPIDGRDLQPYEDDAARLLQLPNAHFDLASWRDRMPPPLLLDDSSFENVVIQHSPETNFGERYGPDLAAAPRITAILHANVTDIRLAAGTRRIGELQVTTPAGTSFKVLPRAAVLATGGIENARLLLASRTQSAAGLGNESDMVGRCFMEHLHLPLGHFVPQAPRLDTEFYRRGLIAEVKARGVIIPTASAQAKHRLLTTSIGFEWPSFSLGTPFLGWHPATMLGPVRLYRKLLSEDLASAAHGFKTLTNVAWSAPDRLETWWRARRAAAAAKVTLSPGSLYSLRFCAEQAPHPDNRVRLDEERRDALGMPRTRLEWKIRPQDAESVTGWARILKQDLQNRRLGRILLPPHEGEFESWHDSVIGGPHHMGATRMSANPSTGVVDADCRVHSLENLYVAGSSVFATSGHANPTFTIVCLALRLADHLRDRCC